MFTPASLIAAATSASAPGVFSTSITRSTMVHRAAASRDGAILTIGLEQREQALVFFSAGRTAFQVRPHPGDRQIAVAVRQLEFDVLIDKLEAFFAGQLWAGRSEEALQRGRHLW